MQPKLMVADTGIEALMCGALYRPAPYYARVLHPIDNGAGYWNSLRVGIFQRPDADIKVPGYTEPKIDVTDVQIGEYTRKYSSLFNTFHPFQLRGKWFALYSADYTCTRIMELPSCKDIGGEQGDSFGFCPVDYWVPGLHYIESIHDDDCPRNKKSPDYTKSCSCPVVKGGEYDKYHKWHFPERVHGFIAGCIWGDDSSWKIEYLDLSKADEGIIKREARFGYIEMPAHLDLNKAVNLDAGDGYMWLRIATEKNYDLETGKTEE